MGEKPGQVDEEQERRAGGAGASQYVQDNSPNNEGIAIGEEGVQRTAGAGAGIAIDEEGVQRLAGGGGGGAAELASSFNSSKSNVFREVPPAARDDSPAAARP